MAVNRDGATRDDQAWPERSWKVRLKARDELVDVTCDLVSEFSSVLPAGRVIRQVVTAREGLLAAGVRAGLPDAVRTEVRVALRKQLAMSGGPPEVA